MYIYMYIHTIQAISAESILLAFGKKKSMSEGEINLNSLSRCINYCINITTTSSFDFILYPIEE